MKKTFIILLVLSSYFCSSQEFKYEIAHKTHKLGDLIVSRTKDNEKTVISVTSDVKVKLILNIDLRYELKSSYNQEGELTSSSVKTFVNNKLHSDMAIDKKDHKYQITNDGDLSVYNDSIGYSGAMLYLYEPIGITKMFSEIDGYDINIKKMKDGVYQLIHAGKTSGNEFVYKDGHLKQVTIHHTLLTFTITQL